MMLHIDKFKPTCKHHKVYSGECIEITDPPRWFWACTLCLETGSEPAEDPPNLDPPTYWQIMRTIHPNCWVPAKYR